MDNLVVGGVDVASYIWYALWGNKRFYCSANRGLFFSLVSINCCK